MEQATIITENHSAPKAEAETSVQKLLRYSDYCHVGPGADTCDEGEKGTCEDPFHYHFYCRLPNQFQHGDIREAALAAKARRMRQLRDPEADSWAILQADMETLKRENSTDALITEITGKNWFRHYMESVKDVQELDEFEHIEADQARLAEIEQMDDDLRPKDEYEELKRHIEAFNEAVDKKVEEATQPEKDALAGKTVDELIEIIREDRIEAEGNNSFMQVYSLKQMHVGTLKPVEHGTPKERAFSSVEELGEAPPEVVEALIVTFRDLETALREGDQGNS
jgi:hypothetical protein